MKKSLKGKLINAVFGISLIAVTATGYSQAPVKLEYNYPSDKPVSYLNVSKINQLLDFQGQSMEVNVFSSFGCTVKSAGMDNKNLKLEVTIDSLTQTVDSPNGMAGGPVKEIQGKSFNMILSPEGRETDVTGAEQVVFSMDGSAQTNATQFFNDFFPDIPAGMVKPGDTWNSTDSVNTKTPSSSSKMLVNSVNKFEGIENINGLDCAKILSVLQGTMYMTSQSQGMDIVSHGPFTGTSTVFFAVKEGYFVKQISNTKLTGTVDISGAQSMSFPVVMDMISTVETVK